MGKDLEGKELGRGITQRKDGRYSAKLTIADGKRKEKTFETKTEARKWLKEQQRNVDSGLDMSREYIVDEWFEEWFDTYKKDNLSKYTEKSYLSYYRNHIAPNIGKMKLNKVKPKDIQKVINKLKGIHKASSIINYTNLMYSIFDAAVREDLILKNPVAQIKAPKKEYQSTDHKYLCEEDLEVFVKYLNKTKYRTLLLLLVETGLRISEVLALTWEDILWEKGVISISKSLKDDKSMGGFYIDVPKTKSSIRNVPLNDSSRKLLEDYREQTANNKERTKIDTEKFGNLIFVTRTGFPVHRIYIDDVCDSLVKKINADWKKQGINRVFPHVSPHTLRHTYTSLNIQRKVDITAVSRSLGHSNISTTLNTYTHTSDNFMLQEFGKVSGLLSTVANSVAKSNLNELNA